jgi:hypothetical protein
VDYVNLKVSYGGLKFSSQWNFFHGIVKKNETNENTKAKWFSPFLAS